MPITCGQVPRHSEPKAAGWSKEAYLPKAYAPPFFTLHFFFIVFSTINLIFSIFFP